MLGSLAPAQSWHWSAVGKHPAAADYIYLNNVSVLTNALADWMAKGYDQIGRSDKQGQGPYSWRFWLQGAKKGNLICGLGRDSSDRIGRPYPLLLLGEGGLKKWEKQWQKLPECFLKTWQRLEYIAAQRYEDVNALSEALKSTPSPAVEHMKNGNDILSTEVGISGAEISACRLQFEREGRALIRLADSSEADPAVAAAQWHAVLKGCSKVIPRAVFWGGTPRYTFLAVYQNALSTKDFVDLWSL